MIMTVVVLQLNVWTKASLCDYNMIFFLNNHQAGYIIRKGFIHPSFMLEE